MVTQELSERDSETHKAMCEEMLQNFPSGAVLISSDEAHLYLSGTVNQQLSATTLKRTLETSTTTTTQPSCYSLVHRC